MYDCRAFVGQLALVRVLLSSAQDKDRVHLERVEICSVLGALAERWADGTVASSSSAYEIKREILAGELSTLKKAILPVAAALGGMAAPGLIYAALNASAGYPRGWGIPMATDIAFALGILTLLGPVVPPARKVFLTALAIADDLGALWSSRCSIPTRFQSPQ